MELDDIVRQVQDQLTAAAALGDARVQEVATALATAASPAIRLGIMTALSGAADEITAALLDAPGAPAVAIRLDGGAVRVEVSTATEEQAAAPPRGDDGDASARISLRLSERLKSELEDAAARDGLSVNTWLVRAATGALSWSNRGPNRGPGRGQSWERRAPNSHRVTGWIDG